MKVQIDENLFYNLLKWHLLDYQTDEMETAIKDGLQRKFDALVRRDLYTKSKTATTPEAREAARLQYLDKIGLKDAFRR